MPEGSGGMHATWDARGWRGALLVVAVTLIAQSWILDLPFQLDDYRLLPDPLSHFAHARSFEAESDLPAFMLRWPLWLLWAAIRPFAGDPLAPFPYHVVGLLLHAAVALLLARTLERLAAPRGLAGAGLAAGVAFGIAAGHVQAVSWTSAWSSLLYTLFGLAAFGCLGGGIDDRPRALRLGAGALLVYLALVSKASAVVVPPLLALLLLGSTPARRRPFGPLLALAAAAGAYALSRWLWFGALEFRYYAHTAPAGGDLLGAFPSGMLALGQALYPWSRAPELVAADPLFARLFARPLGIGAPLLAALLVLPGILLAAVRSAHARRALLLLAPALLLAAYPAGVLHDGQTTNVAARATYLPMVLACALLGLSFRVLWSGGAARRTGVLWALVLAGLLADGLGHVVSVERAAAAEQRHARDLVASIVEQQRTAGRSSERLTVLAVRPPSGLADLPVLGDLLPLAFRPPFARGSGVDVRVFADGEMLVRRLPDEELARRDVALIGPVLDDLGRPLGPDPAAVGETNRRRRALRRHGPLQPGLAEGIRLSTVGLRASADGAYDLATPVGPHALGSLALEPPHLPWQGELAVVRTDGTRRVFPVSLAGVGSPAARLALDPRVGFADVLGEPVARIVWHGPAPLSVALLEDLPALLPSSPVEGGALELAPEPPRFAAALPAGWIPGTELELELRLTDLDRTVLALASAPTVADAPLLLVPRSLYTEGTSLPWEAFAAEAARRLDARGQGRATASWRLTLRNAGGLASARGPLQTGFLAPRAGP